MNSVLAGLTPNSVLVYVDDIIVHGSDIADHNNKLNILFSRLRKHNLKLQPEKCHFLQKEIMYLGHIISDQGVKPNPAKIEAVKNYPRPKKAKDIRAFLGFVGYYRRFIPNFSELAKPLSDLLKKDTQFKFDESCERAFQTLKHKLTIAPILAYPDFDKEFYITSDASGQAIGAVLSQGYPHDEHPICFISRVLNSAETRYSTIEKELLAVVYAVEHFLPYIYGRHFTIITDHKPLIWLMNLKDHSSRLMRWRIRLEEYDYKIIHKAGKLNCNADALSRAVQETGNIIQSANVNAITRNQANQLKMKQLADITTENCTIQTLKNQIPIIEKTSCLLNDKLIKK